MTTTERMATYIRKGIATGKSKQAAVAYALSKCGKAKEDFDFCLYDYYDIISDFDEEKKVTIEISQGDLARLSRTLSYLNAYVDADSGEDQNIGTAEQFQLMEDVQEIIGNIPKLEPDLDEAFADISNEAFEIWDVINDIEEGEKEGEAEPEEGEDPAEAEEAPDQPKQEENVQKLTGELQQLRMKAITNPSIELVTKIKSMGDKLKSLKATGGQPTGSGKGRGWHGDPEGHSTAAKKDFLIDDLTTKMFDQIFVGLMSRKDLQKKYAGSIPVDIPYKIMREELKLPISIKEYQTHLKRLEDERDVDLTVLNDPVFAKGKETVWKEERGHIGFVRIRGDGNGKGRGWWGESERHSTAAKKDFDDSLPLSLQIRDAVDAQLVLLKEQNDDLNEDELLPMAYDLVRRANPTTSDFVDDGLKDRRTRKAVESGQQPQFLHPQRQAFFKAMQPLEKAATSGKASSTNVANIGYNSGILMVNFNNGSTYSYDVTPDFYTRMAAADSKGKFLWKFLRGKEPGHVIDNPSKTTAGGVGGSIVTYFKEKGGPGAAQIKTSKKEMREVVHKYSQFPKLKMKEIPPEKARKERKRMKAHLKERQKLIPKKKRAKLGKKGKIQAKAKITEAAISEGELSEAERGIGSAAKQAAHKIKALMAQLQLSLPDIVKEAIQLQIAALRKQFPDFRKFLGDFITVDDTVLHGPITRAGNFRYGDSIKQKDWDNLKQVFAKIPHFPAFDAHDEAHLAGFAHGPWEFNESTRQVLGNVRTFEDVSELSDLSKDNLSMFPVSIRFNDQSESTDLDQNITDLLHLAISFNKTETDRCSSEGGSACWISPKSDFMVSSDTEGNNTEADKTMPDKKDKKKKKDGEEEEEEKDMVPDTDQINLDFLKSLGYKTLEDFEKAKSDFEAAKLAKTEAEKKQKAAETQLSDFTKEFKVVMDFMKDLKADTDAKKAVELDDLKAKLMLRGIKEDFVKEKSLAFLTDFEKGLPAEPTEDVCDFRGLRDLTPADFDEKLKENIPAKWETATVKGPAPAK